MEKCGDGSQISGEEKVGKERCGWEMGDMRCGM